MKQGSHIMLQRLVRSTVRTDPRPYLMEEVPWLWSRSVTAGKSRPGNRRSIRFRKSGLIASTSVNVPCCGQVFSTITLPSRSMMCALISPTRSLASMLGSASPERMRARVSFTRVGHSESVVRGQPSTGDVRSALLSSGAGAQTGWPEPAGTRRLTVWNRCQAASATNETADSICRAPGIEQTPLARHYSVPLPPDDLLDVGGRGEALKSGPVDLPARIDGQAIEEDESTRDLVRR